MADSMQDFRNIGEKGMAYNVPQAALKILLHSTRAGATIYKTECQMEDKYSLIRGEMHRRVEFLIHDVS